MKQEWVTREENQTEYFKSDKFNKIAEYQRRIGRETRERNFALRWGPTAKGRNVKKSIQ